MFGDFPEGSVFIKQGLGQRGEMVREFIVEPADHDGVDPIRFQGLGGVDFFWAEFDRLSKQHLEPAPGLFPELFHVHR